MVKSMLLMGCFFLAACSTQTAQVKDHHQSPDEDPQIAAAANDLPPHEIAYTDQYGFHFDKDNALVDANGHPVTTDPK
jgi:hypothetical protein